ncbi:hypothetical protein [Bradyrhizobium sp. WSM3983]|uniref:hypothetical protein n=1 Tax=Bradyrhizobium sp. WSM3983 TaxID=1038867 RepID=UPI00041564C9|nr:hypothetical protein [Bradyrhizobium sp. WSM3983]
MDESTLQFYRQNAQSYADWAKAPSTRLRGFLALLAPVTVGGANQAAIHSSSAFCAWSR